MQSKAEEEGDRQLRVRSSPPSLPAAPPLCTSPRAQSCRLSRPNVRPEKVGPESSEARQE